MGSAYSQHRVVLMSNIESYYFYKILDPKMSLKVQMGTILMLTCAPRAQVNDVFVEILSWNACI